MDQQSSSVKAPSCVPIFIPPLVIGNFEPKELALILALQAHGANFDWIEATYADLSVATTIKKGALPLLVANLQRAGIIEKALVYDGETGRAIHLFKLNIWEWAERNSA